MPAIFFDRVEVGEQLIHAITLPMGKPCVNTYRRFTERFMNDAILSYFCDQ